MRWSDRYRPKAWDDVAGQSGVVAALREFVASGAPRSVLLAGPSGTGKTTLARIYARASMCLEPLAGGSACLRCESCEQFENEYRHPNYLSINCALHGGGDDIAEVVRIISSNPLWASRHVAFLDEAHALSLSGQTALLTPLENVRQRATFILATTEAARLNTALPARLRELRLKLPTREEAITYLRRICGQEGVAADDDVLSLVASGSRGYRALAENLEKVASSSGQAAITPALVRSELFQDRSGRLVAYLQGVCAGDRGKQLAALEGSELTAQANWQAILGVLTYLKARFVGPALFTRDGDLYRDLIDDQDAIELVQGFKTRAEALNCTLPQLFDEILEFWMYQPAVVTDVHLEAQTLRFHDLLHELRRTIPLARTSPQPSELQAARSTARLRSKPTWRTNPISTEGVHGGFLTGQQASELFEAATFFPQVYGVAFNGVLKMRHLSDVADEDAARTASRFAADLAARYLNWLPTADPLRQLQRITYHDRFDEGDLVSHIFLHVPAAVEPRIERWLERMKARPGVRYSLEDDIEIVVGRERMSRHWDLLRTIWRGIDPAVEADRVPLVERLGIGVRSRGSAGALRCRRYSMSNEISPAARDAANAAGMGHLSAYADGAWQWLFRGWELEEAKDRERYSREQQVNLARFEGEKAKAGDSLHTRNVHHIIENTQFSSHTDPKDRRRNAALWW